MDLSKLKPEHQKTIRIMHNLRENGYPVSNESIERLYNQILEYEKDHTV